MKVKKFVPKKKIVTQKTPPEKQLTQAELSKLMAEWWECQQRIAMNRAKMGISAFGEYTSQFKLSRQQELHQRQRDARSVGMPPPIAVTEWGENVYPWGKTLSPPPGWSSPQPTTRVPPPQQNRDQPTTKTPVVFKPTGGPGVIATIIKVLTEEASKSKPMSKKKLLVRLAALLPDRDAGKMANTVRAQLAPSGLPSRGVNVRGDDKTGYWIRK